MLLPSLRAADHPPAHRGARKRVQKSEGEGFAAEDFRQTAPGIARPGGYKSLPRLGWKLRGPNALTNCLGRSPTGKRREAKAGI